MFSSLVLIRENGLVNQKAWYVQDGEKAKLQKFDKTDM